MIDCVPTNCFGVNSGSDLPVDMWNGLIVLFESDDLRATCAWECVGLRFRVGGCYGGRLIAVGLKYISSLLETWNWKGMNSPLITFYLCVQLCCSMRLRF